MTKPDLMAYSIEELEAMNQDLMKQRAQLIVSQREIANMLDQKRKAQALQTDIAALQERHGVTLRSTPVE